MTLQELLGIRLPIIQAPMAGAQSSALAIAVSNAGGLGSLPCALLGIEGMREELSKIVAQTTKPFNVNFFCHTQPRPDPERETAWRAALSPYFSELGVDPSAIAPTPARLPFSTEAAEGLREFKPAVVSFHFGLPAAELLAQVRGFGAKILSSATTVEEARWLEAHGVDAVIAQGLEAGGHQGSFLADAAATPTGMLALLRQVLKAVRVPVIAAGGIFDAKGVAEAIALGAAGVQVGTAYLLCPEAATGPVHRAALKSDAGRVTALTNVFTGRRARGIVNRLMRERGPMSSVVPAFPLAASALAPLRAKAESAGSGDFSPLWAGQNATNCREISAGGLTEELAGAFAPEAIHVVTQ